MFTNSLTLQCKFIHMAEKRTYIRQIMPFKEYFIDFKKTLSRDVLMKIYQIFMYIMTEEMVPVKFLKNVEGADGLYEIRVEKDSNIYRIFCCFDEGNLIILFNGFQKKSQKTPLGEIKRAMRVKEEYFAAKAALDNKKDK